MATSEQHRVDKYLIKAFARHVDHPTIIYHFREMFGRDPTPDEFARCNLGEFLNDRRAIFDKNGRSEASARIRLFMKERMLYEQGVNNIPIHSLAYRMEKYQELFNRIYPEALATGKVGRSLDLLTIAAKDAAGGFSPSKTVNVDNRTMNINTMSDEELNRKLRNILEDNLGLKVSDMPIIESGDNVIEYEE
jgi:hypothetical protein